jgi:glycosyltransferase involved in cell wall biosynthesis
MIASISVVIPVYNSAAMLTELVQRVLAMAESASYQSEIILVNDGSSDDSWDVICTVGERYPNVRGIELMRNYGQHSALLCGIRAARHDIIVTIDDDLQHPPEVIPSLLQKISEGYDVVYGKPAEEQHGMWRVMASRLTKFALQTAMGAETARNVSAFRAFRTQLREAFANYSGTFVSIDVLLTWATTRFTAIDVPHHARQSGKSHYTFRKLARHALNMMTGFSVWPLQVASVIGFGFTLFGIAVLIYVVGRYLIQGGSVPGFPFLASIISIFSGAQLFALGIIGEYLARMHFRTMERPAYVVRSTTSTEPRQVQI